MITVSDFDVDVDVDVDGKKRSGNVLVLLRNDIETTKLVKTGEAFFYNQAW